VFSTINSRRFGVACLFAASILAGSAPTARAQAVATQEDVFAQTYNAAMQAFAAQKWAEAAAGLEKMLSMVVDEKQQSQMAPVYYTLGAAHFNTPNYPRAIEVFKVYLKRFPNHEKVLEVRLALAQSLLANKEYDEAAAAYEKLEAIPNLRQRSLAAQAQAFKELGRKTDVVRVLEKLCSTEITTPMQARGAIQLAETYAEVEAPEKAVKVLQTVSAKTNLIDNLVSLNVVAIKLGDGFLEKKKYGEAIAAYRAVKPRTDVIKFQNVRIAALEKRMEANLKSAGGNLGLVVQMQLQNNELRALAGEAKAVLVEFEKLPDYASSLLFREARCWSDWDRKWEAIVVYRHLLQKFPQATEREPVLYGTILAYADLNRVQSAQKACDRYLKEFPTGPNAGTVGYLMGAVSLQAGDPKSAESFFGVMLEKQPNSEYREEMRHLLGNAKFAQGKWDEALREYKKYLTDFPNGPNVEDVEYRTAVTHVFAGNYTEAMKHLPAYVAKYPQGRFKPDAKYRLAVCLYAGERYDQVIKDCVAWQSEFPNDDLRGEVLSLLGDAQAATNRLEEAVQAYVSSYQAAATDEVLSYSLFEASKYRQKLGHWEELETMFQDFVAEKPDHPAVVAAFYWIGKAKAKLGKSEEAKNFLVDRLKQYLNEPKREAVEQILSQLAQLCSKPPKLPPPPSPAIPASDPNALPAVAEPAPDTAAEPPPYDPYAELDRQLAPLKDLANNTGKARMLYARAELASLKKNEPERQQAMLDLSTRFKTEELSPVLLAQTGDYLMAKGTSKSQEQAGQCYAYLKENYLKSDYLDFAYVGLGDLAYQKKQYEQALEFYSDAIEKIGASLKLKEATIGKARTLLELGQYAEARKLFEQVASIREWRGDATAMAVFSLGEIERRQGRFAEAIALYRRVFVGYQKYLPWVAKSYLRCAESFDKMGQRKDAIENLREMLRNEKLESCPEADEARKYLQIWGAA
jgi:TolA-binding protein